jgi:Flp pilus assembly protein TadD
MKYVVWALTVNGVLVLAGCAGWKEQVQPPTVTQSREDRAAEAVREFEERRDRAQLEAALDRWKQGDAARAEAMLTAIVNRRPDDGESRLHLGELLWSRGEPSAEGHFRAVIAVQPERAEAHHALALLLDATGRADESRQHLAKAAELEPENDIYRQTCESLAIGLPTHQRSPGAAAR